MYGHLKRKLQVRVQTKGRIKWKGRDGSVNRDGEIEAISYTERRVLFMIRFPQAESAGGGYGDKTPC